MDQAIQDRWLEAGDRGTKIFCKSFKGLASSKLILELINNDGACVSAWEEIATVVTTFFGWVLGQRPATMNANEIQCGMDSVLEDVTDVLTNDKKQSLNGPLTLEELGQLLDI